MSLYEELSPLVPVCERIKSSNLPVILYGMGNGADRISDYLSENSVLISGVAASEGFLRGQSFKGFKVESIKELEKRFGKLCLVLCFGLEGEKAKILKPLEKRHFLVSPNMPVVGEGVCDKKHILDRIYDFSFVYDRLSDGLSKKIYLSVLKYDITGDISYLDTGMGSETAPDGYYDRDGIHLDVGAYDGDTVIEFIKNRKKETNIIAFEPDRKTYEKLLKNTENMPFVKAENMMVSDRTGEAFFDWKKGRASRAFEKGASGNENSEKIKKVSIDDYCGYKYISSKGLPVGSMKIDAEGEDEKVICGAANTLYCSKSNINVSLYHRAFDLVDIPLLLMRYGYGYEFYIRKKEYVPAWDVMLYALKR